MLVRKNTSLLTECNKQFIACKKSCSCCGNITDIYSINRIGLHDNQINIKKRVYKCKHCGLTLDRDYNACLNILKKG